ncbi:MAG: RNA polymerase sigma-70 factor [Ginsengibacter sp.]
MNLVVLLNESDEAAFEKLYFLYSQRLLGYLIKLVKSETIAGELLQDVFVKIWNSRQNVDPNRSFRSYLFRIAENMVVDFFRKAARDKKLRETLINNSCKEYSHVEESLFTKENEQILLDVISLLPLRRRQIFQLIKIEGYSYEEVSHLLAISPSTISDHIVKATKFIREHLEASHLTAMYIVVIFPLLISC